MQPEFAQALAFVAPALVAALAKAQATNRTRALISVGIIAALVAGTYVGDAHPEKLSELIAFVGTLAATTIGAYKVVQGILGDVDLNELIFPTKGIG